MWKQWVMGVAVVGLVACGGTGSDELRTEGQDPGDSVELRKQMNQGAAERLSGNYDAADGSGATLELRADGTFSLRTHRVCIMVEGFPCPQGDDGLWFSFEDNGNAVVELLTMNGDLNVPVRELRAAQTADGRVHLAGQTPQSGDWVGAEQHLIGPPCGTDLCY